MEAAVVVSRTSSRPEVSTSPDLLILAESFKRSLRAENKSERTVVCYMEALRLLNTFLTERGMPRVIAHIAREHVEEFISSLLAHSSPSSSGLWRRARSPCLLWST
jgi:hypothetical protein